MSPRPLALLMIPANHSSGGQTILMPMTGLVNPTSVSVDGSGNIYVTDYVGTLTKLSVNVGAMKVAASDPQTTTVTNTGNLDLTIASLTFTNGAGSAFSETDTCTSAPIPPGGSCTITVSYSNPAGTATDTLNISSNAFSLSGVTIQVSTNQGIQVSTNHGKSRVRCEHGDCFSPRMPVAKLRERNQTAK